MYFECTEMQDIRSYVEAILSINVVPSLMLESYHLL